LGQNYNKKISGEKKSGPNHGWWYGHHRMDKWHMMELFQSDEMFLSHDDDDDTWDVCKQLSSPLVVVHGMQKATRRSTLIRRGVGTQMLRCKWLITLQMQGAKKGPFDRLWNIGCVYAHNNCLQNPIGKTPKTHQEIISLCSLYACYT
jgi:hypothetical protein